MVTPVSAAGSAVGKSPPGTQPESAYAQSYSANHVKNVFATTQTSCYRPEDPYTANAGPNGGYSGATACPGAVPGEDTGAIAPYATQLGSNAGVATGPSNLAEHQSDSYVDRQR